LFALPLNLLHTESMNHRLCKYKKDGMKRRLVERNTEKEKKLRMTERWKENKTK